MHLIGQPSKKWAQLSTELICIRTLFSGLQSMSECVFVKKHCILCSAQYNSQWNLTSQLYSRLNKQESSTSMYVCVFHLVYSTGYRLFSCRSSLALWFSILQSDLVSNLRLKTVLCVGTLLTIKQCSSQQTGVCVQVCVCVGEVVQFTVVCCSLGIKKCLSFVNDRMPKLAAKRTEAPLTD